MNRVATQDQVRYEILQIRKQNVGGITPFENKSLHQIKELIKKGYLDLDGNQNNSPTAKELIEVADLLGTDAVTFDGYVVDANRSDCRITIDAVTIHKQSSSEAVHPAIVQTLNEWAKSADHVRKTDGGVWLWWD